MPGRGGESRLVHGKQGVESQRAPGPGGVRASVIAVVAVVEGRVDAVESGGPKQQDGQQDDCRGTSADPRRISTQEGAIQLDRPVPDGGGCSSAGRAALAARRASRSACFRCSRATASRVAFAPRMNPSTNPKIRITGI